MAFFTRRDSLRERVDAGLRGLDVAVRSRRAAGADRADNMAFEHDRDAAADRGHAELANDRPAGEPVLEKLRRATEALRASARSIGRP